MPILPNNLTYTLFLFMWKVYYIFLLCFFGIFSKLEAQEDELAFLPYTINYTTKNGLPSNETYCIAQDTKGYIWIGTDRGVVRYNGYDFEVFTTENGLLDNVVFNIQVDEDGKIWFLPWNKQIFYYEHEEGFKPFKYNRLLKEIFPDDGVIIDKITNDPQGNYHISGIKSELIEVVITSGGEYYTKLLPKKKYEEKAAYFIKTKNSDRVFRIGSYSEYIGRYTTINHIIDNRTLSSFKNVFYPKKGFIYHPSFFKEEFASYMITGKYMTKITNTDTTSIVLKQQVFATKTKDGYIVGDELETTHLNFNVYWQKSIDPQAKRQLLLKNVFKTGALKDNDNGIWVTTHNKGVFYIPDISNMQNKDVGNVSGIIPKKEEILLYNTNNHFFSIKTNNKFYIKKSIENYLNYNDLFYHDKFLQSRKVYDVFNIEADISQKTENRQMFSSFEVFDYRVNSMSNDISLLTINSGTRMINMKMGDKNNTIDIQKINSSIKFFCYEKDSKNSLWLGTMNGVYRLKSDTLVKHKFSKGYITDRVQDIKFFNQRNLSFFATIGNGLYIVENNTLVKHYTKTNGLSSNSINQLYIDDTKKIWIATNAGFHYIDLEKDTLQLSNVISNFSKLISPNIKQIYVRDSLIFLGTDSGLNTLDWKQLSKNRRGSFPIYFQEFKVNQHPVNIDSLAITPLTYKENNIEITYRALDYKNLGQFKFRYRLSETEDYWHETTNTTIRLTDQKPGKYTLQLEAKNDFGDWIPAEKVIPFQISKPYWQTIWFKIIMYLSIILIVFAILFLYYNNKEKQRKLNDALNSNMQKLFSAQLNPHFVFNSLNAIQNFILKNDRMASNEYLGKFALLIRNVFENSNESLISLEKELKTLNIYIELEQLRFKNAFDYSLTIDPQLDVKNVLFPCNLLQPIAENAIQHGLLNKTEKGLLSICINKQENMLLIVIKDNGVGRDYTKSIKSVLGKKSSKGLELTKKRLQILSKIHGAHTNILVKDLFKNQTPAGTEVHILIPIIDRK